MGGRVSEPLAGGRGFSTQLLFGVADCNPAPAEPQHPRASPSLSGRSPSRAPPASGRWPGWPQRAGCRRLALVPCPARLTSAVTQFPVPGKQQREISAAQTLHPSAFAVFQPVLALNYFSGRYSHPKCLSNTSQEEHRPAGASLTHGEAERQRHAGPTVRRPEQEPPPCLSHGVQTQLCPLPASGAPLCTGEHNGQSRWGFLRPRVPLSDCWGVPLAHGGCTWASKPLRSKVSSLKTARGNGFFLSL